METVGHRAARVVGALVAPLKPGDGLPKHRRLRRSRQAQKEPTKPGEQPQAAEQAAPHENTEKNPPAHRRPMERAVAKSDDPKL